MTLRSKFRELKKQLAAMESVAIAFSGGVDSAFLACVAAQVLKNRAVAFTAISASYPIREREESIRLARSFGLRQHFFKTRETSLPVFKTNPQNRCYHCKKELYQKLLRLAKQHGLQVVLDGSNADDAGDYRPGLQALRELKIRSPLKEVGLTKAEIRRLSKQLRLPTWNKQAFACLASRFQYGDELTDARLKTVEKAEDFLRDQGFRIFRVRDHGTLVRLETGPKEFKRLVREPLRSQFIKAMKQLGYHFVSVDLEGYRTGSMNTGVKK